MLHENYAGQIVKSRRKDNIQESIQSHSTSYPKHQTGKEHKQLRRHKVEQHKRKTKMLALSKQMEIKVLLLQRFSKGLAVEY